MHVCNHRELATVQGWQDKGYKELAHATNSETAVHSRRAVQCTPSNGAVAHNQLVGMQTFHAIDLVKENIRATFNVILVPLG